MRLDGVVSVRSMLHPAFMRLVIVYLGIPHYLDH